MLNSRRVRVLPTSRAAHADSLEFRQRDQARKAAVQRELEALRAEALKVPDLEAENASLKGQLALLSKALQKTWSRPAGELSSSGTAPRSSTAGVEPPPSAGPAQQGGRQRAPNRDNGDDAERRPSDAGSSGDGETVLKKDLAKLTAKYTSLKAVYNEAVNIGKRRKKRIVEWAKYADQCDERIELLQQQLASCQKAPRTLHVETRSAQEILAVVPPSHVPGHGASFHSDAGPSTIPAGSDALPTDHLAPRRAISAPAPNLDGSHRASSVALESTQGEQAIDDVRPSVLPPETVTKTVSIKREPSSDGPLVISERPAKKRKQGTGMSRRIKLEDGGSDPVITGDLPRFAPQESMDLDEGHEHFKTPRKRRLSDPRQGDGREEIPAGLYSPEYLHNEASDSGASGRRESRGPVSANRRIVRTYGTSGPRQPVAKLRLHNHPVGNSSPAKDVNSETTSSADSRLQLGTLLNQPSPGPGPILPRRLSVRRFLPETGEPGWRASGKAKQSREASTRGHVSAFTPPTVASARIRTYGGRTKAEPPKTPLREKPLSSLRLDDFRINPRLNAGEGFAFTEVVRNRADRDGLAGCVDPNCCGKHWRVLALSERNAVGPSLLVQAASIRLMEDHLGDDAHRLGTMTRKEKEDLWLEAKIRDLADRYGRHRHRFHRQPSPPGFWDADFPTTQEQEKQDEEAVRREKALVQDRYREAMRKDGRWLFRDE